MVPYWHDARATVAAGRNPRAALYSSAARAHRESGGRTAHRREPEPAGTAMTAVTPELAELRRQLADAERTIESLRSSARETSPAQAAHARLAAIVESSNDAIILLDAGGRVEVWNGAAEKLYGYTAAEVLGRTLAMLSPPDREHEHERVTAQAMRGETVELETVRCRRDGTELEVSITLSPVRDARGTVTGFSKIARDITERRRAVKRFRMLMESAPDAMVTVDRAGMLVLVNAEAERLFGYAREELIGRSVQLLVPEAYRAKHARLLEAFAVGPRHRGNQAGALKARRHDGTEFDAEITLNPLDDGAGEPTVIAAIRDVTERNKMRDQLILSDRMVSIGTLAAGVAHEINNPLSAVIANLDMAIDEVTKLAKRADAVDELMDELRDAREGADRVRQIVRDLKIFSRSEDEFLHPVDVRRVLESTLRMAWNEIRHRARLVKDFGPVPLVRANDSRLGQIFLNIVVNAAQAIAEGRAESNEIRVTTGIDGSGLVVVAISDTGPGMPPEILNRLFTPFFTTKPAGIGTGLGLSICHRLVTNFGGRITVESAVGRGSVFRVFLQPATQEEAVVADGPAIPRTAPRRGRILVVDDERAIGLVAKRALGAEHDVTALTSAQEALHRIEAGERFDMILCDLMMPEMTGIELHAHLLRIAADQAERMLFVTGGAFTATSREFLDRTTNLHIEKPFNVRQLRALVSERLR